MITGMNHAGVVVKDLEQALEFYHGLLGLQIIARREREGGPIDQVVGYPNTHLMIANVGFDQHTSIELIQYAHPRPTTGRRRSAPCLAAATSASTWTTSTRRTARSSREAPPS